MEARGASLSGRTDQVNQALLEAFSSNGASSKERELEEKVTQLEQLCGKQAVQIDLLKKTGVRAGMPTS